MKLVKINPSNMSYYSRDFIKGFECGAKRQLEADKRSIPKGHWITYKDEHRCSKCGESVVGDWYYEDDYYDYCPWCGVEMDGEDK